MLNVFIPGPNVLSSIATVMGSALKAGMACAFAGHALFANLTGAKLTFICLKAVHSFRRENTSRALSSKTIFFCAALSAVLASI